MSLHFSFSLRIGYVCNTTECLAVWLSDWLIAGCSSTEFAVLLRHYTFCNLQSAVCTLQSAVSRSSAVSESCSQEQVMIGLSGDRQGVVECGETPRPRLMINDSMTPPCCYPRASSTIGSDFTSGLFRRSATLAGSRCLVPLWVSSVAPPLTLRSHQCEGVR